MSKNDCFMGQVVEVKHFPSRPIATICSNLTESQGAY